MESGSADDLGEGIVPEFLRKVVGIPKPSETIRGDLLAWDGGAVLADAHFFLAMSMSRRFAYWVAWNIDGGALKRLSRLGIGFALDPWIPAEAQAGNDLYEGNRLDRGHLARRAGLTWGPMEEAVQANTDSFIYMNITPQMEDFNQSGRQGLWDGWRTLSTRAWRSTNVMGSVNAQTCSVTTQTPGTAGMFLRVRTAKPPMPERRILGRRTAKPTPSRPTPPMPAYAGEQ